MKQKIKGYFSVEASLLFPCVLLIQIVFVYLAIFCYDRCVLEQCAYEAALRGSYNMIHDNESAFEITDYSAKYLLSDRLFSIHEVKDHVEVTANKIEVTYECFVIVPFLTWMSEITNQTDFSIKVSKSVPRIRQVKTIRAQEFGKEIIEGGDEKLF